MPSTASLLYPLLQRLERWKLLAAEDRDAILSLPAVERRIEAGHFIVREGDEPRKTCLLLSGFAFRQKESATGRRQILSVHVKGDLIDLQNSLLGRADHNVQMLSTGRVAMIPVDAIRAIAFAHPAIGLSMWYETLVDGSIFREWIFNIGRRDARTRIAHLLCEFALLLQMADLGGPEGYELPMTQEQLADATGLTSVHVNRMLSSLTADNLISRTNRMVTIGNWAELARVGDFDPAYLHLAAA